MPDLFDHTARLRRVRQSNDTPDTIEAEPDQYFALAVVPSNRAAGLSRRTMILYDNVRARWRERDNDRVLALGDEEMTPDNFERLQEAENQYRDLASQVRAFADTQSPTCVILRWIGFDMRKASSGLIGLSNTLNTYGKTRAFQKQTINEALKFPP
jgi:hypothetical protein